MSNTYLGYLLVILSALAFASMSLFTKMAYGVGMSPWSFSLIQSSLALLLLGALLMRQRQPRRPVQAADRPRIQILFFLLCGAGAAIAFNVALVSLSMSLGTILLFTYPAFTAVGAWLVLGQRPTRLHAAALLMTLAGAFLTANLSEIRTGAVSLPGVALALLAAVSHGFYMTMGEKLAGTLTATAATALTRLAILTGSILLYPRVFAELPHVPLRGWLICLVTALVSGVAPFLFLNRGIALIGANRAAIASVAELPFALGLGLLFQGDLIRPAQWVGAVLIIVAVIASQKESITEGESADGPGTGTTGSL